MLLIVGCVPNSLSFPTCSFKISWLVLLSTSFIIFLGHRSFLHSPSNPSSVNLERNGLVAFFVVEVENQTSFSSNCVIYVVLIGTRASYKGSISPNHAYSLIVSLGINGISAFSMGTRMYFLFSKLARTLYVFLEGPWLLDLLLYGD